MKEIVKKIVHYWNKIYWNEFDRRAELEDLKKAARNEAFWTEFSRRTSGWFLRNEDASGCAEKEGSEVVHGQRTSFMPLYEFENSVRASYSMLQDDSSRKLFWARLKYEIEGKYADLENLMQLVSLIPGLGTETSAKVKHWAQTLLEVEAAGKKLVLYGGGEHGEEIGSQLIDRNIPFYGLCAEGVDLLLGKPTVTLADLVSHSEEYVVFVVGTVVETFQIMDILAKKGFPQAQIINFFSLNNAYLQYFEFPAEKVFPENTAFIDGGCFDTYTSRRFAEWCDGRSSKIVAFEPDPINIENCRSILRQSPLDRFELRESGLSKAENGNTAKMMLNGAGSCIVNGNVAAVPDVNAAQTILLESLDNINAGTVGFIKLDVEGAELDSLIGAKNTIKRDAPFLALCLYHKWGDMLTIMEYLRHLVPEYQFMLRHYGARADETVLYASIRGFK